MKRTNLLFLLEDYKSDSLYVPGSEGGELTEEEKPIIDEKEGRLKETLFLDELRKLIQNNNNWLKIIYALLIALVIFLSVILWVKQNNKEYFLSILGGQGASIIFCINRLSYFYKYKRSSEILLLLYTAASTKEEKNKIIDEIIQFLKGKK